MDAYTVPETPATDVTASGPATSSPTVNAVTESMELSVALTGMKVRPGARSGPPVGRRSAGSETLTLKPGRACSFQACSSRAR